jgi:hypothetical protein
LQPWRFASSTKHVVEFEEGQRLVAIQAHAHRIHGQHAVDREMPPDVAQERDVAQFVEPVGVVDHQRRFLAAREIEEGREIGADPREVFRDGRVGQQFPRFVPARRVADPGRAAAHQRDRLLPGALQPAQHHDLHQAADMQGVGGAVEADIADDAPRRGEGVEPLGIRDLMDEAALLEDAQQIGTIGGHCAVRC